MHKNSVTCIILVSIALTFVYVLTLVGEREVEYDLDTTEDQTQPDSAEADSWCRYISSSPEPRLLLYNRVPKAGGSTIRKVLKTRRVGKVQVNNETKVGAVGLLNEAWGNWVSRGPKQIGNLSQKNIILSQLEEEVNRLLVTKKANFLVMCV